MKNVRRTLTTLAVLAALPNQTFAQMDEDMMGDISLEDLLTLEVSVASTKAETITSTPAVVSRYSSEDLQLMGLRTLQEFLGFVPGFVVDQSNYGQPGIQIRGTGSDFGSKALVLLDGVPYWSPSHSQTPINGMTFETIDRIEVIRGPGAVIYGSNAIAGVINVITKNRDGGTANINYGSDDLINSSGYYSSELAFGARLTMGYEIQRHEGYDYTFEPAGALTSPLQLDRKTEKSSALARLQGEKYNVSLHMFDDTVTGINAANGLPFEIDGEAYLLAADYTFDLGEDGGYAKVYGQRNKYTHFFDWVENRTYYEDDGNDNTRDTFGVQVNYPLTEDLSILAGAEMEEREVAEYFSFPIALAAEASIGVADTTDEDSAYIQLDYSIGDWRFLAGGRYIDNEKAGDDINPRASVVYNISDEQSLKLLYSVGFTSPNFLQTTGINIPNVIRGNPELVAETITTFDLAYTYASGGTLFVANLYYYEGEEFITRFFPEGATQSTFRNGEKFDRRGAEIDYQTKFDDWTVFANLAYNDEGEEVIEDDPLAALVPQFTGNVGVTYRYENHRIGGTIQHVSDRLNLAGGEVDAYTNVNINYSYLGEGYEVFFTAKNLLSEDLLAPDVSSSSPIIIPRDDLDVNFRAGVRFSF